LNYDWVRSLRLQMLCSDAVLLSDLMNVLLTGTTETAAMSAFAAVHTAAHAATATTHTAAPTTTAAAATAAATAAALTTLIPTPSSLERMHRDRTSLLLRLLAFSIRFTSFGRCLTCCVVPSHIVLNT